jgi:hypothetical protein
LSIEYADGRRRSEPPFAYPNIVIVEAELPRAAQVGPSVPAKPRPRIVEFSLTRLLKGEVQINNHAAPLLLSII